MPTVKTYHSINANQNNAQFAITAMADIYQQRNGKQDEPHRHDYFTVLVIRTASGTHKIDFNSYPLGIHQVFFVSPGQVHQIIENKESDGFVMTFSTEFLIRNGIHLSFIESLNLFQVYGQSPPLQPEPQAFEKIERYTLEIYELFRSEVKMKELSIGAFLKLILIECNNICTLNQKNTEVELSDNKIIREFKQLVDQEFRKEHSTSYYAGLLNITPDHLNRLIKNSIGKSAKEYIQSRITTEAKRLLYFSDLSAKEIGYELGFSEPANFSAFFKKCTGYSPSNFLQKESAS